jgi:hypothetical protein
MYIRENAMRSGTTKNPRPMRQLAKARVAKNAVEAAVWPDGNALYRGLKRGPFHSASVCTLGRARPVDTLITRAATPASAHARIIAAKIRIHFLLRRQ